MSLVAQSCLRDTTGKPGANYLLSATLQHLLRCSCPQLPAQALACVTFRLVHLCASVFQAAALLPGTLFSHV